MAKPAPAAAAPPASASAPIIVTTNPIAQLSKAAENGSLVGFVNRKLGDFAAERDAKKLFAAMEGLGTDEETLIEILTGRSSAERQQIVEIYQKLFGHPLAQDIKGDTSFGLKAALLAQLKTDVDFDVGLLNSAIKGLGTTENILIEVLCSRPNAHLKAVKEGYLRAYGRTLESDIEGDTSGSFKKCLLAMAAAQRDETIKDEKQVDKAKAKRLAMDLYQAGANRFGTDEGKLIEILCHSSLHENKVVNAEYKALSGSSLYESIDAEASGWFKTALLAAFDPVFFLTRRFGEVISLVHTNDDGLIRLLRMPREMLYRVKIEFYKTNKEGLLHHIERNTLGDYRRILLRLGCCSQFEYNALLVRESMRGIGTDSKALIEYISSVPTLELQCTTEAFLLDYSVKLTKAIKSETMSNFCAFMCGIATPKHHYLAKQLHKAIAGVGTKDTALIEILTSRTPAELKAISEDYTLKYKSSLVEDIKGDTTGNYETVLVTLARAARRTGNTLKAGEAEQLADQLYKAGEGRIGTNDDTFISILTSYSPQELQAVAAAYKQKRGKELSAAIKSETSGNYETALLACLDPVGYATERLYKTMKGIGTNDAELIRLIAGRTREELKMIEQRFQDKYGEPLVKWLKDDLSGNYLAAVLAYMGHPLK
eukprot:TRINITY_DN7120_c0_g1_i1.p1 TRINITY_DN7120_c0_g1~~TRINITY_DN7120_c0_g1_i1.p1  ORF type:complete len:662 (+),score=185.92 TRINITY_DN7120_c0_g1_i1:22-1986(+)